MKQTRRIVGWGTVACAVLAGQAWGTNITVPDFNGPVGAPINDGKPYGWDGGPGKGGTGGVGFEDNEVEVGPSYSPLVYQGQKWDLEAFALTDQPKNGAARQLFVIGGFDFENGEVNGAPGDLFIKIGGNAAYNPTGGSPGIVKNGVAATGYSTPYDFDYVVRLADSLAGPTVKVYQLTADSRIDTVQNDSFGSNPWKLTSTGQTYPEGGVTKTQWSAVYDAALTYSFGLTSDQVGTLTGVTGLLADNRTSDNYYTSGVRWASESTTHNVIQLELSFLGDIPVGEEVWFSYTMQCGNDMMKGSSDDGFRVPDGGTTLALLGIGFAGLGLLRRTQCRA